MNYSAKNLMSRRPLIGLTPSHDVEHDDISMRPTYLGAVKAAGGIPVVLPLEASDEELRQLSLELDGFLFTGGPDPHPFLFGEETHAQCGLVSVKRDSLETRLLPAVMETRKPILGICRGIQIINVALGGTIFQDIPSQFKGRVKTARAISGTDTASSFALCHKQPFPYAVPSHTISVVPGTRLASVCRKEILSVNSMHHQAVRDIAPCLTVCGTSPDGLIEAAEMPDYPFLIGVQWHPEYLWPQDPAMAELFASFIAACKL